MRKARLNQPAAELAQRYSESVSFDWRLYPYDIAGSLALKIVEALVSSACVQDRHMLRKVRRLVQTPPTIFAAEDGGHYSPRRDAKQLANRIERAAFR
jgi:hypothetical protein